MFNFMEKENIDKLDVDSETVKMKSKEEKALDDEYFRWTWYRIL